MKLRVPKTSGQGTSRAAYQASYRMGQRGTGAVGENALRSPKVETKSGREYTKGTKKPKSDPFNISYGDTLPISDLKDLKGYLK